MGTPINVLMVTNMYPSAEDPAYGVFVQDHVEALTSAGLQVEVMFIDGRTSAAAYVTGIDRVRRRVRRGGLDIVHAHFGFTGFVASFQALPLVVTFHGDDLLGKPSQRGGITLKSRLGCWLSRRAARRAQAVICVSDQLRVALRHPEDRERAHVIPGGINIVRFHPGDRDTARSRLGWSPGARIALFPSTPGERRKRLDLARSGVDHANAQGANIDLLVVSGVSYESMPDYYRAADCLLLTSDWEGSPTVVKEALCCDLPVVSVDAGDAWRWLALAEGCQCVEREVPSISAGLRAVLSGPSRVDGARVRERTDWRRIVQDVIGVYEVAMRKAVG
jgi:glycosyltransferase involved in cell wall biosynthesis